MKRVLLATLLMAPMAARAQTSPNVTQGQVWTIPQWNAFLASKADTANPVFTGTINGAAAALSGALTVGTTLGVTGAATFGTLNSASATSPLFFENGPSGAIMLEIGGSNADIEPKTDFKLQGGAWGSSPLANNTAPLTQNASFTGSVTTATANFGAWLQQTDNSSCTNSASYGCNGFTEHLILNGSSVIGSRTAGIFILDINAATGNSNGEEYVALGSKCNLMVSDPTSPSSQYSYCFGFNPVSHIGANAHATQNVGTEIDTWEESGAVMGSRIGLQIVDVTGSTYGTQASTDDVALSLNNQYAPSSSLGFKIGLGFGRSGGQFPVSTTGTLISGEGNAGAAFTVANGIDWHLGTFTGNTWNDGHVTISGSGVITMPLTTGTPSTYACFTSGGTLISSATAC